MPGIQAFAEEQAGTWGRMLAPAADRDEVDTALASLIDISGSPQYGCAVLVHADNLLQGCHDCLPDLGLPERYDRR